jgi:hypothetical protein
MHQQIDTPQNQILDYTIDGYSGYAANFHPSNIQQNKPNEQSSRWASASTGQSHYVMIKLEKLSVVSKYLIDY